MRSTRNVLSLGPAVINAFLMTGCAKAPDPTVPGAQKPTGQVQWVDPKTIQPGPIRHEALNENQLARIRALHITFAEVDPNPLEKWVDNFKRDADPDRELEVWERMARAYRRYCETRPLSPEAKRDVFRVVLLRSTAPEQEVLEKVKLKTLSRDEAAEIMKGY